MNVETFDKGKFTTQKSIVLKSCSILDFIQNITSQKLKNWIFICHIFILGKIILQVNNMPCL